MSPPLRIVVVHGPYVLVSEPTATPDGHFMASVIIRRGGLLGGEEHVFVPALKPFREARPAAYEGIEAAKDYLRRSGALGPSGGAV